MILFYLFYFDQNHSYTVIFYYVCTVFIFLCFFLEEGVEQNEKNYGNKNTLKGEIYFLFGIVELSLAALTVFCTSRSKHILRLSQSGANSMGFNP